MAFIFFLSNNDDANDIPYTKTPKSEGRKESNISYSSAVAVRCMRHQLGPRHTLGRHDVIWQGLPPFYPMQHWVDTVRATQVETIVIVTECNMLYFWCDMWPFCESDHVLKTNL